MRTIYYVDSRINVQKLIAKKIKQSAKNVAKYNHYLDNSKRQKMINKWERYLKHERLVLLNLTQCEEWLNTKAPFKVTVTINKGLFELNYPLS